MNSETNNLYQLILCIVAYMWFHTGSLFIASLSLLNVFMSIPLAIVIYRYILNIQYFTTLNLSVIIIIIGIGADNIFVFHDFWKNSFQVKAIRDKPILRLSKAFKEGASAMFVTSLTSMVAFSACTSSAVMPIRAFGWFATLIVPLIYFQIILVQPFIYFFYELHIMNSSWKQCFCCCFKKGQQAKQPIDLKRTAIDILEEGNPKLKYEDFKPEEEKQGKLQKFFYQTFGKFVWKYRQVIITLGLVMFILCGYAATQLTTSNKPETLLKKSNPLEKALTWVQYELYQDAEIPVYFNWGIEPEMWDNPEMT